MQIKLLANDMGRPRRISTEADVVITIGRNKNAPRFSQEIFHVDLTENYDVDRGVINLRAQDSDSRVRPAYHVSSLCVWY